MFCIWIILCVLVALAVFALRGNLRHGITMFPLFLAPFTYVCCYDVATVWLLLVFLGLVMVNCRMKAARVVGKWDSLRHPKAWVSVPLFLFALLVWMAFVGANGVISALLVPDFMEKLEAFEKVTEKSYSELVQTDDITNARQESISDTREWLKTVDYEWASVKSYDDYKLQGVTFYAEEESHKWVLLVHGYTGWKEEMYPFAYRYALMGYNSVVPDCRCSGSSEGDFIGMGYTDSSDMMIWINYIRYKDPEAQIVLHGQSMGGATVLLMAGIQDLPDNVVAVVSDCAYSDAYAMFESTGASWLGLNGLPDSVLEFICFTFRLRGGYDLHKASPIKSIGEATLPILFFHGDQDRMIPVSMVYDLYDATNSDKELYVVEGAGHAQSQDKDPEGYFGRVEAFLSKYVK